VSDVAIVNSFDGRAMYAEYFRSRGLTVCEANRPEEALRQLKTCNPSVVVTDLVFLNSSFDGADFIRALRRAPATGSAAIVVVSGYVRQEDQERARAAGADLFLAKPCLPEALLPEIEYALTSVRNGKRPSWTWNAGVPDRRQHDRRLHPRRRSDLNR
jgi:CheY-like chemotaxis protein